MIIPLTLLLLNVFNFMMAVVVMIYIFPSHKLPPMRWLLLLITSFCIISFCTCGVYISKYFEAQILFSRMRFLALGILPSSWILFFSSVYGKPRWLQNKWVIGVILAPGLITTLMTLIPSLRDLIATDFSSISVAGLDVLQYKTGPWFMVHYSWALFLVFSAILLGIYLFIQEKGVRRHQVVILTICSMTAAAVDIYCVLTNSPLRWLMLASATFIFGQIGIVFSAMKLRLLNIVPLAMNRVFHEFPDPVIVIDGERIIRRVNKAAIVFFNLKDVIGLSFQQVLPDVELKEGEICLENNFHEKHYFNVTLEKLGTDEDLSGQVVFFRQVTLQKGIEKRLNENLEFKARLLALIAHDLSGHIEAQALLSSSLKEEVEEKNIQETIELLTTSTIASQGFVENIMSWVRGQGTHFNPVRKNFEWNVLIKDCIEELETSCKLKNIEIVYDSSKWPLIGVGDSDMLIAVVRNLLSNSIRATPNKKKICVYLHAVGNNAEVTIIDEGIGMGKDLVEMIRNAPNDFSFNDSIETGFKSYGIGLMIVKHFIALHHGEISVESEIGSGTRASFYIPLG